MEIVMVEINQDHDIVTIHVVDIDDDAHHLIVENLQGNFLIEIKDLVFFNIRNRSSNGDRRRKRDRSRSSYDHKSSSKRHRSSSKDDKRPSSHSHKNGDSKKH
jgi:hypothetical protein